MAMMNVIVPEFGGPDRRSVSERITENIWVFLDKWSRQIR